MNHPSAEAEAPVVVVTGAAGLVGRAIAAALAGCGATAVSWDLAAAPDGLDDVVSVDVTDEDAVRTAANHALERFHRIDALVHAAAFTGRSAGMTPHGLADVELQLWRRIIDVNLTGSLITAREVAARLSPGPLAQILLIGSIQGLVPTLGNSAYAVSKAATVGLTKQLAAELAAGGIRVNMLSLGPIADDREVEALRAGGLDTATTPTGRFGSPHEVAQAVADLILRPFPYMTGTVIPLDGGEHLRPRRGAARKNPHD